MNRQELLNHVIDAIGYLEGRTDKENTIELRKGLRKVAQQFRTEPNINEREQQKSNAGECSSD